MDKIRQLTGTYDKKGEKEKEKKGLNLGDVPADTADRFKKWRALNPKALQDIEMKQMDHIHAIFRREVGEQLPLQLELLPKEKSFLMFSFKYTEAKISVTDLDFDKKTSLDRMKDNDGPFKFQAEELVKIITTFQQIKKKRHTSKGFYTDPENLWCEEVKDWAVKSLSLMEVSEQNKELIYKRIRYFEEILCADELFDRPNARYTHTIQQVVVACRATLKYHTIPVIDKELAHHDARRAFDSVKKHLIILVSDSIEFLFHVFRVPAKKGHSPDDMATKLLSMILEDDTIQKSFPDSQQEIRQRVMGQPEDYDKKKDKQKDFLKLGPNNSLYFSEEVLLSSVPVGQPALATKDTPITDQQLARIFVGEQSGLEKRFRGNAFIARQYLKTHALILELGFLYTVIDKAAQCASQGGTLLVYGLANAQLNAMLNTAEKLLQSLRDALNVCSQIAEVRFEELVYNNEATISRNPWIGNFKLVHSNLAKIDKMNKIMVQEIGAMKVQANSMTLYEQFQKAQNDTDNFLSSADDFSKHMSGVLGIPYEKPKPPPVLKLPDQSTFSVAEGEAPPPKESLDLSRLSSVQTTNF